MAVSPAFAQTKPGASQPAAAPAAKPHQLQLNAVELTILIKSTIMALQHANQTGNYSVLRDLGTPVFRERFDQARLTAIFSSLRSRGVNLSPAMMMTPNLLKQPDMTAENQLHLVGNFPSQPLQVQYEMLFLSINGTWRLDGLSVDAVPVQGQASAAMATPQPAPAAPAAPAAPQGASSSAAKPEKKPGKAQN